MNNKKCFYINNNIIELSKYMQKYNQELKVDYRLFKNNINEIMK
jgi:hypothetical protein